MYEQIANGAITGMRLGQINNERSNANAALASARRANKNAAEWREEYFKAVRETIEWIDKYKGLVDEFNEEVDNHHKSLKNIKDAVAIVQNLTLQIKSYKKLVEHYTHLIANPEELERVLSYKGSQNQQEINEYYVSINPNFAVAKVKYETIEGLKRAIKRWDDDAADSKKTDGYSQLQSMEALRTEFNLLNDEFKLHLNAGQQNKIKLEVSDKLNEKKYVL